MTEDLKKTFWCGCVSIWKDDTNEDIIKNWIKDKCIHPEQIAQLLLFKDDDLRRTGFDMCLRMKNIGAMESIMRYTVDQVKNDKSLLRFIFPYAGALQNPYIIEDIMKNIHPSEALLLSQTHEKKKTALDIACESDNEYLVSLLLDKAMEEGDDTLKKLLGKQNKYGVPFFLSLSNNVKILTSVLRKLKNFQDVLENVTSLKDKESNAVIHKTLMNKETSTSLILDDFKSLLVELKLLECFRYIIIFIYINKDAARKFYHIYRTKYLECHFIGQFSFSILHVT